jgi:NUMOD3 motif/HNH endonuclease
MPYKGTSPGTRTGQFLTCPVCSDTFYRCPSQVKKVNTCSKKCLAEYSKGEGNPFWGKTHSMETRQKVSYSRKGKALGNTNGKGFRHTPETREAMRARMKRVWQEQRQKMLDRLPRGEQHHMHKLPIERRYRNHFTHTEKREWKESACRWCGATDNLTLAPIIPIFMGGQRHRENAQTLCLRCNQWKLWHVDVPQWHSLQAAQAATNKPE